jgi:endonuclease/exonuclease/phosphatase (EEP) superfamily protein YafD
MIMMNVLHGLVVGVGVMMVIGTLVSLSRHPHWSVRVWDFPRLHIAAVAALCGVAYAALFSAWHWYEWLFILSLGACFVWQGTYIFPYLPIAPVRVKRSDTPEPDASLRLVITNVLMQNHQYERLLKIVRAADPDVIFAAEVDEAWLTHLQALACTHPYVVSQPQDNMYGMAMFSRLKLIDPEVRFIVQNDIPSIHTQIELGNGTRIVFHGLHPRPPEPLRDQNAVPRDAELILVGKDIGKDHRPVVVAGDLNDVAWSHTTNLFLHISRLLDPRMGRGMYSTFHASYPFFRFPLDHVFHSNDFTLVDLRRLGFVGSDHLPICIALRHTPEAAPEQPEPEQKPEQHQEAEEKIELAEAEEGCLEG